ncbi:MAG: hypothetical protein LBE18_03580 [Planctomycetaceae bacterium]|jgi:hypothetical protein|nr:hypothetical protein [Planctomycetaceae bacterium]
MDYYLHEEIAHIKLFQVRISDSELQLYEQCLYHILNNCDDKEIRSVTNCISKKELSWFWQDIAELVLKYLVQDTDPQDALDTEYIKRLEMALDNARKNNVEEDENEEYLDL